MDDIKKLIKDLTAGIKALPKALTKKRLIAAFCITALVCGACCICSLYYFEDANFFSSFYGCSTLDEQHSYYRLDDKKYIIYPYSDKTAAIDAFLNDLSGGSYEIKEGIVTPFDNITLNGQQVNLVLKYCTLPSGQGYYLVEIT